MRFLVLVALGFQPRRLLFKGEKFLLILNNLLGGGTCPGNLDDRIAELVVGCLGLTDHNLLCREVLEVIGIESL